jgi:Flp pilus assembly protein TadG
MRFTVARLLTEMRSILACRRGQVAIIFAFAVTMLFVAVGMGIDLWQAYAVKARLQSAVDAAALAIASTDRTQFTDAQLQQRVQDYVTANYPTAALGTPDPTGPKLSYGANVNIINVSDTASVPTTFMRVVGVNTLSVSATGQAKAAWPNIDFYLLLDSSPSMAIPATQAGIDLMINKTKGANQQENNDGKGCAFACHETKPFNEWGGKGLGNINQNTGLVDQNLDNYGLAKQLGITLRIDNLRKAAQDLMTTAQNTEAQYNLTNAYRMAIYTFDVAFNTIQTLTTDLSAAQTAAGNIQMLVMCQNNVTLINGTCTNNGDADTDYDNAMTNINATMPAPGHGTKSPGDTPKEILFLVTDGVEDEKVASCTTSATVDCSGTRQESVMDPGWCKTMKDRGIVIAVLYTEYLAPVTPGKPPNTWYMIGGVPTNGHVSKYQAAIATALGEPPPPGTPYTGCATPGLYTKVTTNQDISAALSQLFLTAVNSVFLSK